MNAATQEHRNIMNRRDMLQCLAALPLLEYFPAEFAMPKTADHMPSEYEQFVDSLIRYMADALNVPIEIILEASVTGGNK